MRYVLLLVICISTGAAFTLEELIDSAYAISGLVANSDIYIEKNETHYKEIRSRLMPQISLYGKTDHYWNSYDRYSSELGPASYSDEYIAESREISRNPDRQDLILTEMLDSYSRDRSFAPKAHAFEFGISLEQPIFQQGKVITAMRKNKMAGSMLVCNWQDAHMKVKAGVSRYYYEMLLDQEVVSVMQTFIEFSERKHYDAVNSYEAGELIALDTLSTYLGIFEAQERHNQAESKKVQTEMTLRRLTGMDSVSQFNIEGELAQLAYTISFDSAVTLVTNENKRLTHLRGSPRR